MNSKQYSEIIDFIQKLYPNEQPVPLHAPRFLGNEKQYLAECIDSTFVSYVGAFVSRFEEMIAEFTGAKRAIALVNGTAALHMALLALGVKNDDEVITQPLTFVATCNAIRHCGAWPCFVDVGKKSLGICPDILEDFLAKNTRRQADGSLYNNLSGRRIAACMPMHTFGQVSYIDEIMEICAKYDLPVLEDAAEALGSFVDGPGGWRHAGTIGIGGVLSFNGNKPVTTGGGGMFITSNDELADRVRHISTTAKKAHAYRFDHDMVGYNLRLPNINAALGCAQMERFAEILSNKRELATLYAAFFKKKGIPFIEERPGTRANYWLNAVLADSLAQRDELIEYAIAHKVQMRPAWTLMNDLPMYENCAATPLPNARFLSERLINLPSSYRV